MSERLSWVRTLNPTALGFAAGIIALGRALQISNGTYNADALWWVSAALLVVSMGVLAHRVQRNWSATGVAATSALLAGGIAWQLWQLATSEPGFYIPTETSRLPFRLGLGVEALLVAAGLTPWSWLKRGWFPAFLAVHLLLGTWMIKASPNPYIDVVVVHKEAIEAFLDKRDPYRISFPNIYGRDWKYYYNPAVVFGDRIGFGYPYPPPSLLLAIPGHVLFGDYRYSELGFMLGAAALIGYSRRHRAARLAAVALLTTPRGFFVLEQGWTEPIALFLVALTTFLLMEGPVRASWAAGLMLATKQYLPFTGLAVLRSVWLDTRRWKRTVFWIGFTGLVVTLPFALWHTNSFMRAVVWLQTLEPFRGDSLSFLAWADRHGWGRGSFLWAVGAAISASLISLVTTRNSPSGFAASAAFTMFAMFVFGSKAFCNYYYFVIGALCCALAAFPGPGEDEIIAPRSAD